MFSIYSYRWKMVIVVIVIVAKVFCCLVKHKLCYCWLRNYLLSHYANYCYIQMIEFIVIYKSFIIHYLCIINPLIVMVFLSRGLSPLLVSHTHCIVWNLFHYKNYLLASTYRYMHEHPGGKGFIEFEISNNTILKQSSYTIITRL